jgi:hypothetical protein
VITETESGLELGVGKGPDKNDAIQKSWRTFSAKGIPSVEIAPVNARPGEGLYPGLGNRSWKKIRN